MTPEQCRMARAALKWSTTDLAEAAGVNPTTVNRFEAGKDAYKSTAEKLKKALESSGKVSIDDKGCVCAK